MAGGTKRKSVMSASRATGSAGAAMMTASNAAVGSTSAANTNTSSKPSTKSSSANNANASSIRAGAAAAAARVASRKNNDNRNMQVVGGLRALLESTNRGKKRKVDEDYQNEDNQDDHDEYAKTDSVFTYEINEKRKPPAKKKMMTPAMSDNEDVATASSLSQISYPDRAVDTGAASEDGELAGEIDMIFATKAAELVEQVEKDLDMKVKNAVKLLTEFTHTDDKTMTPILQDYVKKCDAICEQRLALSARTKTHLEKSQSNLAKHRSNLEKVMHSLTRAKRELEKSIEEQFTEFHADTSELLNSMGDEVKEFHRFVQASNKTPVNNKLKVKKMISILNS